MKLPIVTEALDRPGRKKKYVGLLLIFQNSSLIIFKPVASLSQGRSETLNSEVDRLG